MNGRYGSYCPVALATEILGERWTLLVISTLIDGVTRFSEFQKALPRISPSVLTKRLASLEEAGLVRKRPAARNEGATYHLTPAGLELEPIIMDIANWGQRWARDMVPDDLDSRTLGWSIHYRMNTDAMPAGRTVLEFDLTGGPRQDETFWIVVNDDAVDVCIRHPGFDPDLRVLAEIRCFTEAWRGFRSLEAEIRAKRIRVIGPAALRQRFPKWLLGSVAAPTPRQRPGRERRLSRASRR